MHKILWAVVLFVSLLIICPATADTQSGFGLNGLAGAEVDQETPSVQDPDVNRPVDVVDPVGSGRLTTTLLGKLDPNGDPQLVVHWDGPSPTLLDVWVDFDADGAEGPEELVIAGRPIEPGVEVIDLDIPVQLYRVAEPELSVRAMRSGWDDTPEKGVFIPDEVACAWQAGFHIDDLEDTSYSFAVFDDGSGEALFVGGFFISAGSALVNGIAKWDGTEWSALSGPAGTGIEVEGQVPSVNALAVYDDGTGEALYAGGQFTTAGGVTVNHIAKWDGTKWSALSGPSGIGMGSAWVNALAVYDDGTGPSLYAGGSFTTAGGVTVNFIAKWDGSVWSALSGPFGTGMDQYVSALLVYDDGTGAALFAGGNFTTAGGVTVNRIAKWDGTVWSALSGPSSTGVNSTASALAVYDDGTGDAMFVGGNFTTAGGVTVNRIAKWDGTEWSALSGPSGTGVDGWVYTLTVYDDGTGDVLCAGGNFSSAGGMIVNHITSWDGTEWSPLDGPSGTGMGGELSSVKALAVYDDGTGVSLYAGGQFITAGGNNANYIAKWGRAGWSAISGPSGAGMDGIIMALAVYDDGNGDALYAGGSFTTAGGVTVHRIAKWDGTTWLSLTGPSGTGVNDHVLALAVFDDGNGEALYAGGNFTTAGGVTVNHIAKWDGALWSDLSGPSGTGMGGDGSYTNVYSLTVYDDGTGGALFAGGRFTTAGGITVNYIAKWDGTVWSALSGPSGIGMDNWVNALSMYDDGNGVSLYAGGRFDRAGGVLVNHIAKWDGTVWSALSGPWGTGTSDWVTNIAVYDDGAGSLLYAGGSFETVGGITVNGIAGWDGSEWSVLSGPSGTGMTVSTMAVHNDGTEEALYVGGSSTAGGGGTVHRIAKWDGTDWLVLSGTSLADMNSYVYSLASYDDGRGEALYVGGDFNIVDGQPSNRIAEWFCESVPPTDPTTLISTTHAIDTWSAANIVGVEWRGAVDSGGSGLVGYSALFDMAVATVPDTIVEIAHTSDPHSTSSEVLDDGTGQWFHLRACDGVGHCSSGVHLGPFLIDASAPGLVGGITSPSHIIGTPLNDTTIDVNWIAATDNLSGVEGYGIEFSSSLSWTCDEIQDTTGVVATSSALPEGQWWAHVCAVDVAGNWGGVASVGPYIIDTTPPEIWNLGSEGGTTDGVLMDGENALAVITQLIVKFSESIDPIGEGGMRDIADLEKYRLINLGADGVLDTANCVGDTAGDDADILMSSAWAWTGDRVVSVQISALSALPTGQYALMVCAVHDVAGNQMVGPWIREFNVMATNHLEDPNFDHGWLEAWDTESPNPSDIRLLPMDPTSESSGIVVFETVSSTGETYEISQCLEVVGETSYGLSGLAMIGSAEPDAPSLIATAHFFRNPGCTDLLETSEAVLAQGDSAWLWGPRLIHSVLAPADALSAKVGFVVEGGAANEFSLYLDETFFFEDIGFIDGFETGNTTWWSESSP